MRICCAINITRSVEYVFSWIGDPEKALQWQNNVSDNRILSQTKNMVGTTFEETINDEKGSTILTGVISKWKPNRLVAFQLDGKYNQVDVEFQLEPLNGYTRVSQIAEIRFKSVTWLIMLFLGSLFKKKIERQMTSEFKRLKDFCENTPETQILATPE